MDFTGRDQIHSSKLSGASATSVLVRGFAADATTSTGRRREPFSSWVCLGALSEGSSASVSSDRDSFHSRCSLYLRLLNDTPRSSSAKEL